MVLFKKDALNYPSMILDFETNNKSFLRMAALYKKAGIENWSFPLTLLQPDLQGVDPYDVDLSDERKSEIGIELRLNPWYYFREVLRLPTQGSPTPCAMTANRANLSLYWCFFNHVDYALVQPRQTGKSVTVDALMVYILYLSHERVIANLITKDNGLRRENIDRIKAIKDSLPEWLVVKDSRDADNQTLITYKVKGNAYKTSVSQSSEIRANKVARGMTAPVFHFDELRYIDHLPVTLPAALAAGTAARVEAKTNNSFYGNLFTTTSGLRDTSDGLFAYHFVNGGTVWSDLFYDSKNQEELFQVLKNNRPGESSPASSLLINGTFNHRQLGRSDEWVREAIANARCSKLQAEMDFLNVWAMGRLSSPLSPEQNEKIYNSEREPDFVEKTKEHYLLRWYIPRELHERVLRDNDFILGVDSSEAVGRDAIGFVMINSRTLQVALVATIHETNTLVYALFLSRFLEQHPTVTLVIEMKSTARTIVDALLIDLTNKGHDPFRRIFNRLISEPEQFPQWYQEVSRPLQRRNPSLYEQCRKLFGFKSTRESREGLYGNTLQLAIERSGHLVYDQTLASELRGLVVKNGRIDHPSTGHDDNCIAWLLCHWFLMNTRYHSAYGMDAGRIMEQVKKDGRGQRELLHEIDDVVEQLKETTDGFMIVKLEQKLRRLTNEVVEDDESIYNLDSLLRKTKEERRKRLEKRKKMAKKPFLF